MDFNNDCVALFNGAAIPLVKSRLSRPETAEQKAAKERDEKLQKAGDIVNADNDCIEHNKNISISAAMKAVIVALIDAGVKLPK